MGFRAAGFGALGFRALGFFDRLGFRALGPRAPCICGLSIFVRIRVVRAFVFLFNMSFMKFAVSWVVRKIACFNMVVLHVAF